MEKKDLSYFVLIVYIFLVKYFRSISTQCIFLDERFIMRLFQKTKDRMFGIMLAAVLGPI